METKELSSKIQLCNSEHSYVFISYSSADSERVWKDVCHLQQLGYNVWIDTNLDATDDSWKRALDYISDIYCVLFVFYMSENSVVSEPCLEELRYRESKVCCDRHNGKPVPLLAIEVNPVGDVKSFRKSTYQKIFEDGSLSKEKKNIKAATLSQIMESYFPDNDKLRILSENDAARRTDYYAEIEKYLQQYQVKRLVREEGYQQWIKDLDSPDKYSSAFNGLQSCVKNDNFLPAQLMLAFLYAEGIGTAKNPIKAKQELDFASFQMDEHFWKQEGYRLKDIGNFKEALAYFLADAIKEASAESYERAARLWMRLSNYEMALLCAQQAKNLGDADCEKLHETLLKMGKQNFIEWSKTIK